MVTSNKVCVLFVTVILEIKVLIKGERVMNKLSKNWHTKHSDTSREFGDKLADKLAISLGSWKFIAFQTCLISIWMFLNITAYIQHWDIYPFVLLNLLFSTQAAYAAPIIMMNQNRQAQRDRMQAEHDYEVNKNSLKEIGINTQLTQEVHTLVQKIHVLTAKLHKEHK